MSLRLEGLVAATHTPFTANGELNLPAIEKQAAHLLSSGVRAAFVGGTTGESASLTLLERKELARRWAEVTKGTKLGLIVHVGANCLADSRELAAQAGQLGALAISAVAPSYFKPGSMDTLIACCAEIAKAAPETPYYHYDIPAMTGFHLSMPEFLDRAAERVKNLAGIKFSNPDLMAYQLCLAASGGKFDMPFGCDEYILGALVLGCVGGVGSTYNFSAPVANRLFAAFQKGDWITARKEQFKVARLVQLLASYGYMAAAKATMGFLGVDVGGPRLPNTNLSSPSRESLRQGLEALGFFDWVK